MKRFVIIVLCLLLLSLPVYAEENELSCKASVLIDANTGEILLSQNENEPLPIASITKIMTLLLTFEAIERGELSFDDMLITSAYAASMGGSDIWLKEGEKMSVNDLIKATVIMSANDAAVVLAEKVGGSVDNFIKMMNDKAKMLNMKNTVFKNVNGLDEDGHYSSAYDVAIMAKELIKFEKIFDYSLTWMDYIRAGETQLVNTNKLIRTYNGITGLKTGTTDKAGSCICASAKRDEISVICVVLGAKTTDERFSSASYLLDYGFENFDTVTPEIEKQDEITVLNGMKKSVGLFFPKEETLLIKKGDSVTTETILPESIEAPVISGDTAGRVVYKKNGEIILEKEIKYAENAEMLNFKAVFSFIVSLLKCI